MNGGSFDLTARDARTSRQAAFGGQSNDHYFLVAVRDWGRE
jgi:hypothetical protein